MRVYEKNGRWYFEMMVRKKRYHQAIPEATNEKEAVTYMQAFRTDLLRGRLDMVDNIGCKLFKELAAEYLKYSKLNNRSYKCRVGRVNKFVALWGNKQLKDISSMDIEKYKKIRKEDIVRPEKIIDGIKVPAKYVTNTTVNRDIEILRKIFNIAIENEWLNKNPCKYVKKLRVNNKIERYLTPEEEIRLMNACKNNYSYLKPIIRFALNTGMRKGEILNLTWKCVNFESKKITLLETKNGKKRDVPINSVVLSILKNMKKEQCCEYVFANPVTKTKYSDLKRVFSNVCEIAEVENFRFHDLRHTAATRMVGSGVPITVAKDILGHSDIHTTMRYAHAITEQTLSAVETLSNYAERNNKVIPLRAV